MAKVKVRLFARLAEIAGARVVEVEIGEGLTAGDVFAVLARAHPKMEGMRVAFAVNREYADAGQPLREGDEMALIPPVSGGASPLSFRAERSVAEESCGSRCSSGKPVGWHFGVEGLSAPLRYGRDDKRFGECDVV